MFSFKIGKLRSLASTNLFILALRLIQFFFGGVVMGIMAYYIDIQLKAGLKAPSPYVFSLVVALSALFTQIIYCFSFEMKKAFVWDVAVGIGFLLSFFWFLNFAGGYLSCGWSSFNPFGSDRCAQTRSVFILQIILAILWFLTGLLQAIDFIRARRYVAAKVEV
jgi:hypothetical protein